MVTWPYWKQAEKNIAEYLGGRRMGILGKEDVDHPLFSIEVKSLKEPPKSIQSWMSQAIRNCQPRKVPIVVVHKKRAKTEDDFVIMRMSDFRDLLGD